MVLDGGGRFNPAGIFVLHTYSVLLAALLAHDRATEDNHTHAGKERHTTIYQHVGTVSNPRQGGINSFPLRVTHRYC